MPSTNKNTPGIKGQEIVEQAHELIGLVEDAWRAGTAVHELESNLFRKLLEMGHRGLGMLFELHGPCDLGERVELSDGGQVKRLAEPHKRDYLSIFGHYELERRVSGSREGQKIEYVALDARLGLPKSKFSYLLQDWGQSLAVDTAYAQASEIVQRLLNQSLSIKQS